MYYPPSKSRCHSLYILGVTEGWGGGGGIRTHPPVVDDQKKPGLNRVKEATSQGFCCIWSILC